MVKSRQKLTGRKCSACNKLSTTWNEDEICIWNFGHIHSWVKVK